MTLADPYLDAIRATKRPILQKLNLQKACNNLPPGELTRLYLQLPQIGGRELCKLAPSYKYMTGRPRQRAALLPQLVPREPEGAARLFEQPEIEKGNKTLFILFGGKDGESFIPTSVFLHLLQDGPRDVLVFGSGLETFYRDGIAGFGAIPFEVSRSIIDIYGSQDYARVVVLGISAGGIFAVRVAELLGAEIALSFAGVYTNDAFRLGLAAEASASAFDPICACRQPKGTRVINVVASKNEFDFRCSRRLKKLRPNLMQYHQIDAQEHNVLARMVANGSIDLFFKMALAKNGFSIWLISFVSNGYGSFVRNVRRLFGVQKVASWYLQDKT